MENQSLIKFKILIFFLTYLIPYLIPIFSFKKCVIQTPKDILAPPSQYFGIIWFILFSLLGITWGNVLNNEYAIKNKQYLLFLSYFMLVVVLGFWTLVYACNNNKKIGFYLIMLSFGITLICYTLSEEFDKILLVPLMTWLLSAAFLNVVELI
jgi:tryptophan-rich sensory protein